MVDRGYARRKIRRKPFPLLGGWLNSCYHYAGGGGAGVPPEFSGLSEHRMVVRRALRHGL
jgi:hypothetical protein